MGKDIEKYIKDHRQELDVEHPPQIVWDKIESAISLDSGSHPKSNWMWKAATVSLLVVSGFLFFLLNREWKSDELYSLGDISSEYREMEKNYQESIDLINASIPYDEIDMEEFGWLIRELEYIESVNEEFRKDIEENADQDKLVEALIDYYEKKLKLLKKLEHEINRRNNEKNETIDI